LSSKKTPKGGGVETKEHTKKKTERGKKNFRYARHGLTPENAWSKNNQLLELQEEMGYFLREGEKSEERVFGGARGDNDGK